VGENVCNERQCTAAPRLAGRSGGTETERGEAAGEEVAPGWKRERCSLTAAHAGAEKPVASELLSVRGSS
jgi:hypothetical protein